MKVTHKSYSSLEGTGYGGAESNSNDNQMSTRAPIFLLRLLLPRSSALPFPRMKSPTCGPLILTLGSFLHFQSFFLETSHFRM